MHEVNEISKILLNEFSGWNKWDKKYYESK